MAAKLFLGGISPNTTTEALEAHFAKYGTVVDAVVMYKDGKHRGFGFVTFESPESLGAVLAEDQVIDGRTIDAKPAVPQGEAPPSRVNGAMELQGPPVFGGGRHGGPPARPSGPPSNGGPACDKVFVGGLAQTTTEEMVREYFGRYGTIIDCVVMKDRGSNRSRGFGFVQFDRTSPVDQIILEYADHQIDGKWVEVKKAVPQDQMPAPAGPPPPSKGAYGPYGGYGCGGKGYGGQPLWAGRAGYSGPPPALYSPYGAPPPQYGMGYNPYGYPSYPGPGPYMGPRAAYRQRPY